VKRIRAPLGEDDIHSLRAGEQVLLSGVVYTARDAAHARLVEAVAAGQELPFPLAGQVLYYTGPCPAPPGRAVGSCGPTTSGRMDCYTPPLLARGLKGMIGKGERSAEVVEAIRRHRAVYLVTIGGAGAYLARCVRSAEVVAYPELGTEAVRRLEIEDLPCVVAIDAEGNDMFARERARYRRSRAGQAGERG
jgi:fumarate hydratase subunit beta